MPDDTDYQASVDEWSSYVEELNESMLGAFERNVEAQADFVESWAAAVEDATGDMGSAPTDGVEGFAKAYQLWMDAAEQQLQMASEHLEGEEVDLEEFRDVWLNTANDAFKEVMSTSAFAAVTGETVEDALEFRQEVDEAAQDTLQELGFATRSDVQEVGERLVELERRQHEVEEKLDRVLEAVEE